MSANLNFVDLRKRAEAGRQQREFNARIEYLRKCRKVEILIETRRLANRVPTDGEYVRLQMATISKDTRR